MIQLVLLAMLAVAAPPPDSKIYHRPYEFTEKSFTGRIPTFEKYLSRFKGKNVSYLEIGVFEGKSLLWVAENILTHPQAKGDGIDIWKNEHLLKNLELLGQPNKIRMFFQSSQSKLRELPLDSYDFIYIDGHHSAASVLTDAVFAWPLLRNGGLLIFDDYDFNLDWPIGQQPRISIDTFVTAFGDQMKILYRQNMVIVEKVAFQCPVYYCSRIGDHYFDWKAQELRGPQNQLVEISSKELSGLKRYLSTNKMGEAGPQRTPELILDKNLQMLLRRIHVIP